MKIELYECSIQLRCPIEPVFKFYSDVRNLQQITPSWLDFQILTPGEIKIRVGTLINYRLRVHGIPLRWQSEITCWDPPTRFVDEQRRGPYRMWTHEHWFEANEGGTRAGDRVRYAVAGGWVMDRLFVRRDIERIFLYRRRELLRRFG